MGMMRLIDMEDVTSSLFLDELRKKRKDDEDQEEGLVVQGRIKDNDSKGKHKSKSRSNKKNTRCYYHHKKGHIRQNCFERQRK